MFSIKKTRRIYQSPHTSVAELDLDGLILGGSDLNLNVKVYDLDHISEDSEGNEEPMYFGS